jgi:hypothetical protein
MVLNVLGVKRYVVMEFLKIVYICAKLKMKWLGVIQM